MKKLLLIGAIIMSFSTSIPAQTSFTVVKTELLHYNPYLKDWVSDQIKYTSGFYVILDGWDITTTGKLPLHIRISKALPLDYAKSGNKIIKFTGKMYTNDKSSDVDISFMTNTRGDYTNILLILYDTNGVLSCLNLEFE